MPSDRLYLRNGIYHCWFYDSEGRLVRRTTKKVTREAALLQLRRLEAASNRKRRFDKDSSDGRRIYFLRAPSGEIKIGTAVNVKRRLMDYTTYAPANYELLAIIPGGYALENELHRAFRFCHIRGEWFRPAPELIQRIEALRAVLGVDR